MGVTKPPAVQARSSRPQSVAHDILKRREKPYRTEHSIVLARKAKPKPTMTFAQTPKGCSFLPIGTPALADRCKELCKQRNLNIGVVNVGLVGDDFADHMYDRHDGAPADKHIQAEPQSRSAENKSKVPYYMHRIGYNFPTNVVDQACLELGYVCIGNKFMTPAQVRAEHEANAVARALARHVPGYRGSSGDQGQSKETPEQIALTIKELFPRIPQDDVDAIVEHAWARGEKRVGSDSRLDLTERVQYAVGARIRHEYTDYDFLLRSFEWGEARSMVEPEIVKKIKEWRGEDDDDGEMVQTLRETIIIDDEDDEADDGQTTDADVMITHHNATADDIGAESNDERLLESLRLQPRSRHRVPRHAPDNRGATLAQSVARARAQVMGHRASPKTLPSAGSRRAPMELQDAAPDQVEIGGIIYAKEPASYSPQPWTGWQSSNEYPIASIEGHHRTNGAAHNFFHDGGGGSSVKATSAHVQRAEYADMRRVADHSIFSSAQSAHRQFNDHRPHHIAPATPPPRAAPAIRRVWDDSQTIDLTSTPPSQTRNQDPMAYWPSPGDSRYKSHIVSNGRPTTATTQHQPATHSRVSSIQMQPIAYDSSRPQLESPRYIASAAETNGYVTEHRGPVHAQIAPIQFAQPPVHRTPQLVNGQIAQPLPYGALQSLGRSNQPMDLTGFGRANFVPAPAPPQPVHGGVAMVQPAHMMPLTAQWHTPQTSSSGGTSRPFMPEHFPRNSGRYTR